jgi:hypothetical protein
MSEVEEKAPPRDDEEDADGDEAPKEEESTANFEPVVSARTPAPRVRWL